MTLLEIQNKFKWGKQAGEYAISCDTLSDFAFDDVTKLAERAVDEYYDDPDEVIKFYVCKFVPIFEVHLPDLEDLLEEVEERYINDYNSYEEALMPKANGKKELAEAWEKFKQANSDCVQLEDEELTCTATVKEFCDFLDLYHPREPQQ